MKTVAVRLHNKNDIRLENFELPEIKDGEILARVVTDSLCMSSYKALIQGKDHKRVPNDIEEKPIIIGHEFCGEILKVGNRWRDSFSVGEKFVIQPALNFKGTLDAPGYSYQYIGGDAKYVIIPSEVMETNNLIKYNAKSYFMGSLAEPFSCVIGAFNANYHTVKGQYVHKMGCVPNGKMLILAGCGPMGLGAISYALNGLDNPPSLLVVTDIDEERIKRAKAIFKNDRLKIVSCTDREELFKLSDNTGYDDIFVFAPNEGLIELGSSLLREDGCLNFFAGPTNKEFSARFNFYDVHYSSTHIVGTSGGNREDMIKAISLMEEGKIDPSFMVSHIGGLDSVVEATKNLPKIPGAKKLIYTNISLPLTRIDDFERLSKENDKNASLFDALNKICMANGNMWSLEAEEYLINNAKEIDA